MKKYETIAVMDFIDDREKSVTDQGSTLARMIRKQLRSSKEFHVVDEKSMYSTLEEEMDKDKLEDQDFLVSVCDQLGADALIVGTFELQQLRQPIPPYMVERYSSRAGRYGPETGVYIQKVTRLTIRAKVVDGKTGKAIFDYTPPPEDRPEVQSTQGFSLFDSGSDATGLRSIAVRPVTSFVVSLMPHYEYERRVLVR